MQFFSVPVDHRIKRKEYEKKDNYFNLAWDLKKLWNMKVTIIPFVIAAFSTVTKGLLKGLEIRGRVRPSKLQHCKERLEYWEESWRLEETCRHSNSSEKPLANADVKNCQGVNDNDNNSENKTVEHEDDCDINCILFVWNVPKKLRKKSNWKSKDESTPFRPYNC